MQHNLKATSPLNRSTLAEWLSYLENSHFKAIDLGLERVKSVAEKLDLLRPAPFVITVGGTNGKGTTCRLLETILINAGYRVGVYSSPHLLHYNERVRIQNQELPDEKHIQSFEFIEKNKTQSLTYFEFSTISALHLFKQANLDVVILEVGLGGRLDATNIVDSQVAVITSIDIDHVDFLGDSREKIAFEKAGIFRENCPVVIGDPNIPKTMTDQANVLYCRLSCRDKDWQFSQHNRGWTWQNTKVRYENLPFCQIPLANAATALAAIQALPFEISEQIIRQSLTEVELVGRFQTIKSEKLTLLAEAMGKNLNEFSRIIIDVGHNPQAARYLAEKLTPLKAECQGNIKAVCGILKDKDSEGILSPLLPIIEHWYCATLDGYRGQSGLELSESLQQYAKKQSFNIFVEQADSVTDAVKRAIKNTNEKDILLIFGSFYTVGKFLSLIEVKE